MKKRIISFVITTVFCLMLSLSTVCADEGGYTIKDYNVNAVLHKNNIMEVHEVINVNFSERRHGIYRYIQDEFIIKRKVPKDKDGNSSEYKLMKYVCDVSDVSTGKDDYDIEHDGDFCVIRIGDEDTKIIGNKRYDIYYTYQIPDDRIDSSDFLYYSVLGAGWETTIDNFSFTIDFEKQLPKSAVNLMKVYSGKIGKKDNTINVNWECSEESIIGSAKNIGPNNAITIFTDLPEGYFEGEKHTTSVLPYALLILFGICAVATLIVMVVRKDEKPVEVVEFYPPKGISSAQLGYIIDGTVDNEDIISMLPVWAKSGYIRIINNGKEPILEKIMDLPDSAPQYEKDLFRAFFKSSKKQNDSFDMSKELGEQFIDDFNLAKSELKLEFTDDRKLFKYNVLGWILGVASMIMLFLGIATSSPVSVFYNVIWAGIICILLIIVWAKRWLDSAKVHVLSAGKKVINTVLLLIIPVVIAAIMYFAIDWVENYLSPIIVGAAVIIQLLIGYLSGMLRTSTEYRKELLGKILGFKHFIETAEIERLRMLMNENPEYFYDVLPYAMVFGLEEKWGKKFEGLLTTQPDWYVGPGYYMFWPMHFNRQITAKINTTIAQNIAKTASTTAGGFSGGGGGGGGGGSW